MEDSQAETETRNAQDSEVTAAPQFNLPFFITLVALSIYFGFQTVQLLNQRGELTVLKRSQEAPLEASHKVEEQFKMIMGKISELAKQGHAGAKMVLEGLQNAGGSEQKAGQ